MLEAVTQVAQASRELALDRVAAVARGRGMMRFVEDQQRTGAEILQHVAQPCDIALVAEQPVRQDEARTRRPGIGAVAAAAAQCLQMLGVDDLEREAEFGLQFVLPLLRHRWRCEHQCEIDAATQQQFAEHEAGLDRLAEPEVVGDQQVDPRQAQRLAKREQLIGIEPDAGAERRLEQVALGRSRGAPADGAQIGGEGRGIAPAARSRLAE